MPLKRIMLLAIMLLGLSWFPWKDNKTEEPPPVEPQTEEIVAEPEPAAVEPPAPQLFHQELPLNISLEASGLGMSYSSSCGGCHSNSFQEWENSPHHLGAQSTDYSDAVLQYGNGTICTQCHFPLAQQHQQLTTSYIEEDYSRPVLESNPSWDITLQLDSVGCASCHLREGHIVGSKTAEQPHTVRNSDEIQSSAACKSCHQYTFPGEEVATYNTFQEWENSPYASAGIECQTCHMQNSTVIGEGYPNHSMSLPVTQGITIATDLATLEVQRNEAVEFSITLYNTGVGHSWPSSSPFIDKSILIRVLGDKNKKLISDISHPIGRHRDPESTSVSIAPGETLSFTQSINVSRKHKAQHARLIIAYQQGAQIEELKSIPVKIR